MESISPSSSKMITSPGFFPSTKQEFVCLFYKVVDNLNAPSPQWLCVIVDTTLWAISLCCLSICKARIRCLSFHCSDSSPYLLTLPHCESYQGCGRHCSCSILTTPSLFGALCTRGDANLCFVHSCIPFGHLEIGVELGEPKGQGGVKQVGLRLLFPGGPKPQEVMAWQRGAQVAQHSGIS